MNELVNAIWVQVLRFRVYVWILVLWLVGKVVVRNLVNLDLVWNKVLKFDSCYVNLIKLYIFLNIY